MIVLDIFVLLFQALVALITGTSEGLLRIWDWIAARQAQQGIADITPPRRRGDRN